MATWGSDAKSYPLRIIGDIASAVIFFGDRPDIFGYELRGNSALDIENGNVIRQVGRAVSSIGRGKAPDSQYPTDLEESIAKRAPNTLLQGVIDELHAALSTGNSNAAAALFAVDAVGEDRTTRTLIDGQFAIKRYFAWGSFRLPYDSGAMW